MEIEFQKHRAMHPIAEEKGTACVITSIGAFSPPDANNSCIGALRKAVQRVSDEMKYADAQEAKGLIADFVRSLQTFAGSVDRWILCKESLWVISATAAQLHVGVQACPCARIAPVWIQRAVDAQADELAPLIEEWTGEFFTECSVTHSETVAELLARQIRRAPCRRWRVDELSRKFGVSESQLSTEFRSVFAISVPRYVHRARLLWGFDALADPEVKIEALLREMGYRSRKDFFRAMEDILGIPSRILRIMRGDDRAVMKRNLRETLLPSRRRRSLDPPPRGDELASAGISCRCTSVQRVRR